MEKVASTYIHNQGVRWIAQEAAGQHRSPVSGGGPGGMGGGEGADTGIIKADLCGAEED